MNNISIRNIFKFEKNFLNIVMTSITILLLVGFAIGFINYLINGHSSYNVSREHPWGILLSTYIFLVAITTGFCIVSSLGHVFGIKEFNFISKRAIIAAIIAILTGFMVIALELGHPFVMVYYNIVSPGFKSAIWWMGALYCFYVVFISFEFFFMAIKENHKLSKFFGVLGLIFGVVAQSNLGSIFGVLIARPAVNGPFYPIYFVLLAMISGSFMVFLMCYFKYRANYPQQVKDMLYKLAKITSILLLLLLFFEIWKIITGLYGNIPEKAATILHIIKQPTFLIGEFIFVIFLPIAVIFFSKGKAIGLITIASLFAIFGIFTMRLSFLNESLTYPMDTMKRSEYELPPTFIEYFPSITETLMAIGGIGVALFLYFIANRVFNLDK